MTDGARSAGGFDSVGSAATVDSAASVESATTIDSTVPDSSTPGETSPGERVPTFSEQLAEQLGGVRGVLESSIPIAVFIVVNFWALRPAMIIAVASAV